MDNINVKGCINYRPSVDTTQVSYINACSIGVWQRWYSNLEPSCIMSCSCKDNPNCHYKNWKRKEQECEKLRFPMKDNNYALLTKEEFENFNQLKKENEQFKQTLEEIKSLCYEQDLNEDFFACEVLQKINEYEGNNERI